VNLPGKIDRPADEHGTLTDPVSLPLNQADFSRHRSNAPLNSRPPAFNETRTYKALRSC